MDARELEKIIQADGWTAVKQSGSHKHYKHPSKSGKVTIPFHGHKDLNIKTVNTILKQAGLK
ncbi:MAG: type II toxin-antitoxin system HicA family toxin [Clostridia bacterium]